MIQFNPYDPCPCQSGKKAKFCCLVGKQWNRKSKYNKPTTPISKYVHDRCYAKNTMNCSTKISKEHYISKNILEDLKSNNKVKITGLPWQEEEKFDLFSDNILVSNILCTTHNEALSPFDNEMGRFFRTITNFDADFNLPSPQNEISVFSGQDLEKWMLKTACALIASNQIHKSNEKIKCLLKDEYVDILFNNKPFPAKWGMYFPVPNNNIAQYYHSISFTPLTADNELKAISFYINNFKFNLILGQPNNMRYWGIYRPSGFNMNQGNIRKVIEICWQDNKYHNHLSFKRVATTKDTPVEWPDYLKK